MTATSAGSTGRSSGNSDRGRMMMSEAMTRTILPRAALRAQRLRGDNGRVINSQMPARATRMSSACLALLLAGCASIDHPTDSVTIPIIMYHHVGDWGPARPDWAPWVVKPADFEAQLNWLQAGGWHTITMRQLVAHRDHGDALPSRPVMLTFDDGWGEDVSIAQQYLKLRGMVGVFFVYTGAIGGSPYMTWAEVKALEAAGHDVQSHTVAHPDLRSLTDERLALEMHESKAVLERELGHVVDAIAYPFGLTDARVVQAATDAGYQLGLLADGENTTAATPAFATPRWKVDYGDTLDVFVQRLGK